MAESFNDPQWVEFEQINTKTLVRPRDDFVFRFGQDFEAGMRSEVGDIVYNPADGLVYRCIKETDSVAPDYTNATSNLYWLWIAGSISGYVSGRGWWTKFADGTLIQRSYGLSKTAAEKFVDFTYPVAFYETTFNVSANPASFGAEYFHAYLYSPDTNTTKARIYFSATTNVHQMYPIAIGRWKA